MPARGDGPIPARLMIVGEAWGESEESYGRPFAGASGMELDRMLHEVGIMRSECYLSNVINARPPQNDIGHWIALKKKDITAKHVQVRDKFVLPILAEGYKQLLTEIQLVQPNLILAFGNVAMWALTGRWGIRNWRGSLLGGGVDPKVIPTLHPATVLREWSQRAAVVADLRRVKKHMHSREYNFPEQRFLVRPEFQLTIATLSSLFSRLETEVFWIDGDIETGIRHKHIKSIGLSWTRQDSICIPFMALGRKEGYWSLEEETEIIWLLKNILTHRNSRVRWQNGLFDCQYIHRRLYFLPRCDQDTMISQHAIFSDLPKSLAFQASLYCEHYIFWKEEGKVAEDVAKTPQQELEGWIYNCKDCVYTREVGEVELEMVGKMGLEKVHQFQQSMFYPVLSAMLRGLHIRKDERNRLAQEVQEQIEDREEMLAYLLGHTINPNSPLQMTKLFYSDLKQQPIMTRAKKGQPAHVTCNDEALQKIASREPLLRPLVNCISDIRTLGIFRGNFILAPLDTDGRMRCSYNIGGSAAGKSAPKTYRLSSSKNVFDTGTNLQNIPSEKSKSVGKASQRGNVAVLGDPYKLPNIRSLFGPDLGQTFFDMDLDRADLQVMAWDADEPLLKAALKQKVDLHLLNVYVLDGKDPPPLEELVETHPRYPDHRGPRKHKREFAKVFCHATDYLGKARTVAAATGRTVHETERAQGIYLGTYKGIATWQASIIDQVQKRRFVENKFGYRWYIFDRIDDQVMPEAVAWIPQSTVSIVINRIWMNLFQNRPEGEWDLSVEHLLHCLHNPQLCEVLLQVHDSLGGQFPTIRSAEILPRMIELSRITIPYDDPLIIPTGIGTSDISWGEC